MCGRMAVYKIVSALFCLRVPTYFKVGTFIESTPSSLGLGAPLMHALVIDGRELEREHMVIPVLSSSRAARLLNKDPRDFGAAVKQLYLSGPAGGAGLRELLAYNESMDTDQPELDSGVASGGATPTLGRGARDAAG